MNTSLLLRVAGIGLIILILCVAFFIIKKPQEVAYISESEEEETLALSQEFDQDIDQEKDQAKIVNEDHNQDQEVEKQKFNIRDHNFILDIETDSLAVSAPVFDGVTDSSLSRGVGRHVTTAVPSEEGGNVVLSGHQWYPGESPGYKVFEDLDALSKDDEVSIRYGDKKYTYRVNKIKVVEPTDVSILEPTEKPQLTLYTCYPRYSTEKRLVYISELIDVTPIDV